MRKKLKTILPLLLAIYIIIDTVLKANNIELCSSTGCEMAGQLLKFDSTYLNYLGIFGALVLVLLSILKSKSAQTLYVITAAAMVVFESLLIASQLNINPEVCKFCLGVYTFLLLILLNANFRVFAYTVPAIASIFVAFSFLAIPKNKALVSKDGLYLIASKTCPHCKKTKAFLNKNHIKYSVIDAQDTNAYSFAKTLNISKIPIAIIKKGAKYQIIVGDENIISKYSKAKQTPQPKEQSQKSAAPNTPAQNETNLQPKLNLGGDEGCSYNPLKESSCESEDGNTTEH